MSLRTRTIIILGLTGACLIAVLFFAAHSVFLTGFAQLERDAIQRDVTRALSALSDELARLTATAGDWAPWDDTKEFVEGHNSAYIEDNLNEVTVANLGLSFMLFLDTSGKPVHVKSISLPEGTDAPLPEGLLDAILAERQLTAHTSVEGITAGILVTPSCAAAVISHPILTSNFEGPIAGTLVLGRYVDETFVGQVAEKLLLSVRICRPADPALPEDARQRFSEEISPWTQTLTKETIAGFGVVRDLHEQPQLIVMIEENRDIYLQGKQYLSYFLFSLIAAGFFFCAGALLLIEHQVVARVRRLGNDVARIGSHGALSERVAVPGQDELASLGAEINAMLGALEQASGDLQRVRAAVDDASDAVVILDGDASPQYINRSFSQHFAPQSLRDLCQSGLASIHEEPGYLVDLFTTLTAGGAWSGEVSMIGKGGRLFPAHLRATAVLGNDEQVIGSLLIYTDISDRKALENKLRQLAQQDGLTGVGNRRGFDRTLADEWRRGRRNSTPLSLIMLDIDQFKELNDTYGHQAGDEVLKAVASAAQGALKRPEDLLARYGGEEFAAVLPSTPAEGASLLAETMRTRIEALNVAAPDSPEAMRVTISLGVATLIPGPGHEAQDLVSIADRALYRAKRTGRNRTCSGADEE